MLVTLRGMNGKHGTRAKLYRFGNPQRRNRQLLWTWCHQTGPPARCISPHVATPLDFEPCAASRERGPLCPPPLRVDRRMTVPTGSARRSTVVVHGVDPPPARPAIGDAFTHHFRGAGCCYGCRDAGNGTKGRRTEDRFIEEISKWTCPRCG